MRKQVTLNSLDGTQLAGHLYSPLSSPKRSALLIHGISSEKSEGGLYEDLAQELLQCGYSILALDLRSHGESQGDQTEFTISGAIADIQAGWDFLDSLAPSLPRVLVGASFGGGLALYASLRLFRVDKLVLLNPRLNYRPWIETSTLFNGSGVNANVQRNLLAGGYCERNGFKIGRHLANELWAWTDAMVDVLATPTLVIHGTEDSVIPVGQTRRAFADRTDATFVEIPNAEHGFTDARTDDTKSEASLAIRSDVIERLSTWLSSEHEHG